MLAIKDLSIAIGQKQLLSKIGFEVKPGELIAILGPNVQENLR